MTPSQFRGRKNARRVNALAEKQKQIARCEQDVKEYTQKEQGAVQHSLDRNAFALTKEFFQDRLIRLQKNASNLVGKIMEQGAAEAVRTKKNRSGRSRTR